MQIPNKHEWNRIRDALDNIRAISPETWEAIREILSERRQINEALNTIRDIPPADWVAMGGAMIVAQAQHLLREAGYDPGPVDGQLSEQTKVALSQYQKANGLLVTGELNEATRKALGLT